MHYHLISFAFFVIFAHYIIYGSLSSIPFDTFHNFASQTYSGRGSNCFTHSQAAHDEQGTDIGACGFGSFGATVNGGDVSAASDLYRNGVGCDACYQLQNEAMNHSLSFNTENRGKLILDLSRSNLSFLRQLLSKQCLLRGNKKNPH